jgi:hypothetical protein
MSVNPEDLVKGRLYTVIFNGNTCTAYYAARCNTLYVFVDKDNDLKPFIHLSKFEVESYVKEIEDYIVVKEEAPEPDTYKPDHYYKNSFKVSDVQEEIGYNVFKALGSDEKAYKSSVWVTYALKHLCRAGNKDDVKLELKKSINYLTKALEGEFINE